LIISLFSIPIASYCSIKRLIITNFYCTILDHLLIQVGIWLVDPDGSGIYAYLKAGQYTSKGSSFTEGIGIMRSVANFRQAKINKAITLPDQDLVTISRHIRELDGITLGSSSALNVAGALYVAAKMGKGKTIVTFHCDLAERSNAKLYNSDFLASKNITEQGESLADLFARYQGELESNIVLVRS
jgi:cysteine synthase A